jgi:hypothetical protein
MISFAPSAEFSDAKVLNVVMRSSAVVFGPRVRTLFLKTTGRTEQRYNPDAKRLRECGEFVLSGVLNRLGALSAIIGETSGPREFERR